MSFPPRLSRRLWLIVPCCAFGFLVLIDGVRMRRVEYVSGLAEWNVDAPAVDAASPTGYARGRRRLIVPEHNNESYQWIAGTQQMLACGEWRAHHVDSDNAPFGRESHAPSPYRWWLALIAWIDHTVSGRPLGLSVERAALVADPLLHLLLLAGATVFAARRFGALPAALLSLGLAASFPFAGGFLPGVPDHHGLAEICALWSVLPLLAGIRASPAVAPPPGDAASGSAAAAQGWRQRFGFLVAGMAGGGGLWISVATQGPMLAGIGLGALGAAWLARGDPPGDPAGGPDVPPWRAWALGGCATSLVAYLIEYFPGNMGLRLEVNHPLYALAWLGAGVVLMRTVAWIQRGKFVRHPRDAVAVAVAVLLLAALPVAMALKRTTGFLAADPLATRLTGALPVAADSLADWVFRDGFTAAVVVTLLPLLLIGPAIVLLARRATGGGSRRAIALAIGPVLIALVFACLRLRWWNVFDTALLALVVATTAALREPAVPRPGRWLWPGLVVAALAPGLALLLPPMNARPTTTLSQSEVVGLAERDLAHWLANRVGPDGAVVLAAPDVTTTMCFYGPLRGLGTLSWENRDGVSAAVRISSASSPAEALELVQHRGITHVIMPSWDSFLDEYARMGFKTPPDSPVPPASFIAALYRWEQPRWLRPVPYQLPAMAGFEGQSVVIFEVVDEQDSATALSRVAEYFVEMGQIDMAMSVREVLRRYRANVGALVAQAQVEAARGDAADFAGVFEVLLPLLSRGDDRALPWDRRVSLAVVLATGERSELAREQVRRCLAEIDETRVRSLTTVSLFRFEVLCKRFGLEISDRRLRGLALDLLHPSLRSRL